MASCSKAKPSDDFFAFSSMLPSHASSTDSAARLQDISDSILDELSMQNVLHVSQLFLLTTEVLLVLPHLVGTALPVRDRLPLALEITPKRVDALMEVSDPVVEAGKLALQLVDLVARILVLVVQVLVLVAETLILVTQSVRVVGLVFVSLAWSKMKAAEILTGGCERHLRVSILLLYSWEVCWRMKEEEVSCRVRCASKLISAKI